MAEDVVRDGDTTRAEDRNAAGMRLGAEHDGILGNSDLLVKPGEGNMADQTLTEQIQQLKEVQAEMKKAKKEAAKKLRNLQRQKKRLSVKARLLTDEDLVQVLKIRRAKALQTTPSSKSSSSHEAPVGDD